MKKEKRAKNHRHATPIESPGSMLTRLRKIFRSYQTWRSHSILFFCIIASILVYNYFPKWMDQFHIENIRVDAPYQHVSAKDLETAISNNINSNFFNTNLINIKKAVEKLPWVESAQVYRNWPNSIQVLVLEKEPIGVWNDSYIIGSDGELFRPDNYDHHTNLPRLIGPTEYIKQVMLGYRDIKVLLEAVNLNISKLELTNTMNWYLSIDNGMQLIVDHDKLNEKLARFLALFPQVESLKGETPIEKVDLRYSNGVAIKWHEPTRLPTRI